MNLHVLHSAMVLDQELYVQLWVKAYCTVIQNEPHNPYMVAHSGKSQNLENKELLVQGSLGLYTENLFEEKKPWNNQTVTKPPFQCLLQ